YSRLAWDVVLGGMSWRDRLWLVTTGGVAEYQDGVTQAPAAWHPIASTSDRPLQLSLRSVSPDYLILSASDGRRWKLGGGSNRSPELISQPTSVWNVSRTEGGAAVALTIGESNPHAISIDQAGVLGIDRVSSVAFMDDSLFVATTDGVVEYAADLSELKAVHQERCRLLVPDSKHGRMFGVVSQGKYRVYDGSEWQDEREEPLRDAIQQQQLKERSPGPAPPKVKLPMGEAEVEVEYAGKSFSHDQPVSDAQGRILITTDGTIRFVGTASGLSVLDQNGARLALHQTDHPVTELIWRPANNGEQALFVHTASEAVWRLEGGRLVATQESWDHVSRQVHFSGRRYSLESSSQRVTFSPPDGKAARLEFDLQSGGFVSDQANSIGLTSGAAWVAVGNQVERIAMQSGLPRARFTLDGTNATLRLVGDRLLASTNRGFFNLADDTDPNSVTLSPAETSSLDDLLAGRKWGIQSKRDIAVTYRQDAGRSLVFPFIASYGFAIDMPQQIAAVQGSFVIATAGGSYLAPMPGPGESSSLDECTRLSSEDGGPSPHIDELWVSPTQTIWARDRNKQWLRLDEQQHIWLAVGVMPAETQQQYEQLGTTETAIWRRRNESLEIVEKTVQGQATSTFNPSSREFNTERVHAAFQQGQRIWLLTGEGIRLLELITQRLLAVDASDHFRGASGGRFHRVGGNWILEVDKGAQTTSYQLENGLWKPTAVHAESDLVDWPNFRARRKEGTLSFELREQADRWQPTQFVPTQGRFDFQIARDAIATSEHLHFVSNQGVITWRRAPGGLVYQEVRAEFKGLDVSLARSKVFALGAAGEAH
ncbi:MAG: hypothetical protein ACC628_07865, partial [Pirellulaceae bacterium]